LLKKYPFYIKFTVILFGLVLFAISISAIKNILIPLSFGLLLAILLNPLVDRFQKWKLPKILAIIIVLLIAMAVLAAIGYLLSTQIAKFSDQLPLLQKRFFELLEKLQVAIAHRFNLDLQKQNQWINEAKNGIKPNIGQAVGTLAGSVEMLILIPLYTFLFLYYKPLILNFLYEVFAEENSKEVSVVLNRTKGAIQSYMLGLLLEALIVATLNSIALMILGVEYAILLGVLGAILNIIPFIGGIIAVFLPLAIATITKDGFGTQIGIIIAYMIIQFIDNHFLMPYIVSSKVKVNALISIVIVLLGGAAWGIPGMFLSIPFIGILKIIFDRIPDLKPWGKLLGYEVPTRQKGEIFSIIKKKRISK
jgi:predicted PurR-regulated permease PerM